MAASKFTESTIEKILEVIVETNSEQLAWESVGISKSTYFRWKRTNDIFNFRVQSARVEFLEKDFNIFRILALNSYYDVLTKGIVKTKTTVVKELVEVPPKVEGEPPSMKLTTVKTTRVEGHTSPPEWAIKRGIGETMDEIDAVNKLIEAKWFDPKVVSQLPEEIDGFNDRVRDILTRNAIE